MGMQLEETPATKGFEVELRRESFYLHQDVIFLYPKTEGGMNGSIEISYSDIPKLRAVLNLVERKRTTPRSRT